MVCVEVASWVILEAQGVVVNAVEMESSQAAGGDYAAFCVSNVQSQTPGAARLLSRSSMASASCPLTIILSFSGNLTSSGIGLMPYRLGCLVWLALLSREGSVSVPRVEFVGKVNRVDGGSSKSDAAWWSLEEPAEKSSIARHCE